MPEQIKPIAAIEAEARRAALVHSCINSACPYPFGTRAAEVFKDAFATEKAKLTQIEARRRHAVHALRGRVTA